MPEQNTPVVLGVDLGTTSTKVVAFDAAGRERASAGAGYSLREPAPGHVELGAEDVLRAAVRATRDAAARASAAGCAVAGISFSSAMHSLVGLGARDELLTQVITWADTRATEEAEELRPTDLGRSLHRATGTPVHPMSPLVKLVHLQRHEPALFAAVRTWVQVKDLLVRRWTGQWVTDRSTASATGMVDLATGDWSADALRVAGVSPVQLPPVVPVTALAGTLTATAAEELDLPASTPVFAGGADGPLANLGVGAVVPGTAALSIGTSGALRVAARAPRVDAAGRTFCYSLTDDLWVVGGATTNGGVVLRWLAETLTPDLSFVAGELGEAPEESLIDLAAGVPAGADGLLMLPHLLSERAPQWSALTSGVLVGLQRRHGRAHFVRAALEGVCQQLALVADSVEDAGSEITEIRATGGFARSAVWRQLLADVLGRPLSFAAGGQEGSSFGAALVGHHALGNLDMVEAARREVRIGEVVEPGTADAAVHARLRPVFASLTDALAPTFRALREFTAESTGEPEGEPAPGPGSEPPLDED
ncbi:gluconokinase [Paenibacillus sp. TRM 82003]|uniref:gluconokinase n=1 Tax=Kineococcus sp. TRM81007 TaxID=2925831 RepID=UPI001F59218C|nr:gluconokinase [Kineococcus sp. TRM81007]MCI2237311.1 gluconokinase [Kineococcus sp. TRM81007]MCI3926582.1 gluconokinase [Paenibacillus sp. TRM 82003]